MCPRRPRLWILLLAATTLSAPTTHASDARNDEDSALRDYHSANGLLNRGLYELAAAEYRKFLSGHGAHEKVPVARYGLAVCLYRLDRHAEAAAELEQLRKLPEPPYAAETATILGQCYLAQGRHADATEVFEEVVRQHAGHDLADDAAAGAVEALYLSARYADAVSRCRLLVSRWPDSPVRERVEFFWGLSAMEQEDHAAAAERFEWILQEHPKGPFADQSSFLLAQCYHHGNLLKQAIRQYRRVIRRSGTRFAADALFGLGMLAMRQGKWAQSGEHLDALIREHPDSSLVTSARFYRGRVHFALNEFEHASACFAKCQSEGVEESLADDLAYFSAKCLLRQDRFTEAARRLSEALAAFPACESAPEMQYDHAVALLRSGEVNAGIQGLEGFRDRFPDHALVPDVLHLLAVTEHDQRRYDRSQKHCRVFVEQYPAHKSMPSILYLSAENDYLSARYAEAVEGYRLFLERFPHDPQIVQARYRLGSALYRLDRLDEALPLLRRVADEAGSDPRFRFVWLALGDIHFERSEWKQAERNLGEYLSPGLTVSSADDALLKLGLALLRQGHHERALRAFDTLLEHFAESPHRLHAEFERGQALIALDRRNEANEALTNVLAEGKGSRFEALALKHLGSLAMHRRDFEAAASLFDRANDGDSVSAIEEAEVLFNQGQALLAAESAKEAEAAFTRFLKRYPSHEKSALATAQLAVALSRQDRYEDALQAVERLEGESVGKLPAPWGASVRYEKAWCLRKLGRSDEAASSYRALLDENLADDSQAYVLLDLAGIEMEANRFEPAAKLLRRLRGILEKASAQWPADLRAQQTYQLGVCEFELGKYPAAVELFEEFVTLFPDHPLLASASFFCGESAYKNSQHEKAVTHLDRVVERFPSDPAYGPSLLRLGECLAARQRWARSEHVLAEYLDHFGDSESWFQAQFGLGWARENQGRHAEAIRAYQEVVDRHQGPTAARAQFQIGECLFAREQYDQAVREFLKVDILYGYPQWSAAALYEAGRCFERMGKTVEARTQFKAVVENHGNTRWARMASSRLTELVDAALPGA